MLATLPALAGTFPGFIENRGQLDSTVRYYTPAPQVAVYFTPEAVVLDLKEQVDVSQEPEGTRHAPPVPRLEGESSEEPSRKGCAIWIRFEGANPSPAIEGRGQLATRYNYFRGQDPSGWVSETPSYQEVTYRGLWPGIDLVYGHEEGKLTYRVVAAPDADPSLVRFLYEGADRVTLEEDGSYRIETAVGGFTDRRPGPEQREGSIPWRRGSADSEEATFDGGRSPLDESRLLWSTFLGGLFYDAVWALDFDSSGDPVVAGYTASPSFPTTPGPMMSRTMAVTMHSYQVGGVGKRAHLEHLSWRFRRRGLSGACPRFPHSSDPSGFHLLLRFPDHAGDLRPDPQRTDRRFRIPAGRLG